jgi:hypothetical protein
MKNKPEMTNFTFMMTPEAQDSLEKRIPKGFRKQRVLRNAILFALKTVRKNRLKQELPRKSVKEQVVIEKEILEKFHDLAKELDMSAGHLLNVALTKMTIPKEFFGKNERVRNEKERGVLRSKR